MAFVSLDSKKSAFASFRVSYEGHGCHGSSHLDANGAWSKNCLLVESKTFLHRAMSLGAEGSGGGRERRREM